ncbi:hypothetical protein IQ260_29840, partial [Leptolyngbya cf. ectocarpi LEGE 11479]
MKLFFGTGLIALSSLLVTFSANAADFNSDRKTDLAVIRQVGSHLQWIADYNHDGSADCELTMAGV